MALEESAARHKAHSMDWLREREALKAQLLAQLRRRVPELERRDRIRPFQEREEREHLIRKRNWLEVEKRCLDADRMERQFLKWQHIRGALRLRQRVEECGNPSLAQRPWRPMGQVVEAVYYKLPTDGDRFLVSAPDAGVGVTSLWIISSSCSSEYIDMKALTGLLLLVFGHGVSSVLHSLQYFLTSSSGLSTFPEVAVAMVDEVQIGHYDSNTQGIVLKQAWTEQLNRDHPGELETMSGMALGAKQRLKATILDLKKLFNQTGSAHIVQRMFGCEWDDEDDSTDGYRQYGYDGEDFISLDLKTLTWVAAVPQAVSIKQRWDQERAGLQFDKYFLTKECVDWLKILLAYGKSSLQRTENPRVSLLQRSPSSPVVCHATGFYPDRVVVFWRRDGQELHEQVDPGEVLPNHDGTFQVSVDLDLTAVPQEDWGRYECVVQLRGIEDISTPLDPALIRTNWGKTGVGGDGVGKSHILVFFLAGVAVVAVVGAVVGVFVYQKRKGSDTSSENTEGQNLSTEYQPLTRGQS
ncbi:unnamed protein product [Gadus morhua 'NCC']